jgi:RND family efflux transporter MFP subunit
VKRSFLLALVLACGNDPRVDPSAPPPVPDRPVARDAGATTGDANASRYVGVLAAEGAVEIAPRVAGVLAQVNVRPGDVVKAGDIVAEMDPTELRDQLRAAQAASAAASAGAKQAAVDLDEAIHKVTVETKAVQEGISAQTVLDAAKSDVNRKRAALEAAIARRSAEAVRAQIVSDQVANTGLRAPFDGTVAERYRDPGNRVEAGGRIVKIVGNGNMRLRFAVPVDVAKTLKIGSRVSATVETVSAPISAVIKQVPPAQDPASGLIFVEAELDGASRELRHGLAAWVKPPT